MAPTPQPPPAPAISPDAAPANTGAAAGRTRIRDQVAENPLMALFGTVIVALLMVNFTVTHSRIGDTNDRLTRLEESVDARFAAQDAKIDRLFEAQNARIDRLFEAQDAKIDRLFEAQNAKIDRLFEAQNARIDRLFEAQDAKFAAQDSKIDEINLKLTALITALNATAEVDLDDELTRPAVG